MPAKRYITRNIGNLRGFSTDSIFLNPPNVATKAVNLQKSPDGTLQLRRGYQCQIAEIGGMGIGTFDDPATNSIQTVCIGLDGFAYNKLTRQIFFYYNGQVAGSIIGATQANPCVVQSVAHGLQTGAQVIIRNVSGMEELNGITFTITVIDADHFSLNGVDSTAYTAYISGGQWSIAFADQRYLSFTIYTDPLYIYSNAAQSISCKIIVHRAAQIVSQVANVMTVKFGHELAVGDVVQFTSTNGVVQQRNVTASTATTVTVDGTAFLVSAGTYINQYINILFGKGFDVASPYLISDFIAAITDAVTGVYGLEISVNGLSNVPAAFLQIIEPQIIDSNRKFTLDYWYWQQVNSTISPPLPGSANTFYQNSENMEIASMTAYDDVVYIANGWDFPQKFDGQTIYRTGMPIGVRPGAIDASATSEPFVTSNTFEYAITYEQIDNRGHIIEGEISEVFSHTVAAANSAIQVSAENLTSTIGNNWNTNSAKVSSTSVVGYGPDANGYYYNLVSVDPDFTLKVGDSAYYADRACAVMTGFLQTNINTIPVSTGHGIVAGDTVSFLDSAAVTKNRLISSVTATTITITGAPVTINPSLGTEYEDVLAYKVSQVFADVAIVDGDQSDVNAITTILGSTLLIGDIVSFIDANGDMQRRTVTATGATTITVDGVGVDLTDGALLAAENLQPSEVTLRCLNATPPTMAVGDAISNNLRINIYRTKQGQSFGVNGQLYLIASIPNDGTGAGVQNFIDSVSDAELGRLFTNPVRKPNPPPISKYVKAYGNQVFYAGGERGNPENSDRVFFSNGDSAESVPLVGNFFNTPNVDDEITGLGIAGTSLIVTKNHSLWSPDGNFLTGQIEVIQIAPGANIGCTSHASIASVGTLMYFLDTTGVYAISENQLFPTDSFGNPVAISLPIQSIFRETNFLPQTRYVFRRAIGINYKKENQYLLFLPCEDSQSQIRTANSNSIILCYDYQDKNWFLWNNMNCAGGMVVIDDNLYFQERRFSGVDGNTANLYKQHRFYRLVDHADHAGPQRCEWLSSWEDLGQPEVRKKFSRCILLMDRVSELLQTNSPEMVFSSYVNRMPSLQSTIKTVSQVENTRNAQWAQSPWSWNYWSGYQDSFISINLKQGTVAKSMQVGFTIKGINMDIRLAGYQLEVVAENRMTVVK